MDISSRGQHPLKSLLEQELVLAQRVLDALKLERKALEENDRDALTAITRDKQTGLAELNSASNRRQQLLTSAGLRADRNGMEQLLGTRGDQAANELWRQLTEIAAHCANLNRHIGLLIQRGSQVTEQALHLLRHGEARQPETYGALGKTTLNRPSRSLGKA